MWTTRTLAAALAAVALAAAPTVILAAPPPPAPSAEIQAELKDIDAAISWIDYLLARAQRGDVIISLEDFGDPDFQSRFVPINRDALIEAAQSAVAEGELTPADAAMIVVLWSRDSGRRIATLRQERADLVEKRAALLARAARPRPPLQPWELGRPPEAKVVTCGAEGVWSNTAEGHGSSTWTISANGIATESGMGGATGQASMSGDTLTITWRTGPVAGVYSIDVFADCSGGDGTVSFTDGPPGFDRTTRDAAFSRVSGPGGLPKN